MQMRNIFLFTMTIFSILVNNSWAGEGMETEEKKIEEKRPLLLS